MDMQVSGLLDGLIDRYPKLLECRADIEMAYTILKDCYRYGGKVLVCGNGGSAADAEHIVGELMKGFTMKRPLLNMEQERLMTALPEDWEYLSKRLQRALPAISLVSQSSIMTAIGNDTAADMVFAQQAFGYGKAGDVLIGLSTSGNASNVVNAAMVSKAFGLKTIGVTGAGGGRMACICDVCIQLPDVETYRIQELALPVYHTLCLMLEMTFFEH